MNGLLKWEHFKNLNVVTKKGTIVPNMSTFQRADVLSTTLFGKTRRAVLSLLYGHVDEAFYLRQITRMAGVGLGAVQRELQKLLNARILLRTVRGRQVYYQANRDCPVFLELKNLVLKTTGVATILQSALAPLTGRIRVAFIFGSIAAGDEQRNSDVDLLVVGEVTFAEVVSAIHEAQETLHREINPTVYPPGEFQSKLAAGHHFLKAVLKGPMVFLIGDKRELPRLVKKRLAD
jgi:uncharacterized protein